MGTVLCPFLSNRSVQYSWLSLKTFLLLHQLLVFVCFVVLEEKWTTSYIKWELIGRWSNHLNTISNLFIVAEHYIHINTCYVLLLNTTYLSIPAMYCC